MIHFDVAYVLQCPILIEALWPTKSCFADQRSGVTTLSIRTARDNAPIYTLTAVSPVLRAAAEPARTVIFDGPARRQLDARHLYEVVVIKLVRLPVREPDRRRDRRRAGVAAAAAVFRERVISRLLRIVRAQRVREAGLGDPDGPRSPADSVVGDLVAAVARLVALAVGAGLRDAVRDCHLTVEGVRGGDHPPVGVVAKRGEVAVAVTHPRHQRVVEAVAGAVPQ